MRRTRLKPKNSNKALYIVLGVLVIIIIPLLFEQSRTFVIALLIRSFFFVKKHIVAFIVSFFLINGKFILLAFVKKIALLTTVGLGKRYVTEKIIIYNFKKHFLRHLKDEIAIIKAYFIKLFKHSPIMQKIIALFAFIASLSVVTKFMGMFLALKVILAKMWSFLLALFLKIGTTTAYFFSDYLWNSFFAPLIEILIFSWLIELLEKIPTFKRWFAKIYNVFIVVFRAFESVLERFLHLPIKHFLAILVRRIQRKIRKLTNTQIKSTHQALRERRANRINLHQTIRKKRKIYLESLVSPYLSPSIVQKITNRRKEHLSIYAKLKEKKRVYGK
ncbi:MAG: hypothetical protein JXQ76_00425 [Campylobacterales bacterium]|nr:hypothetical protein [Campylobacterales bacterium]